MGILIASRVQVTHALWFKQIQAFLYGQAATMTDGHILLYGMLALISILGIYFFYRQIEIVNFDREYAKSVGANVSLIDTLFFFLLVLAVCIGIRSVGVVLMSGMLIAPAVAARQFTSRLSTLFILAGFFGVASGFLGNYLSMTLPQIVASEAGSRAFSLPTGPMILLTASSFCLLSLLFAPSRGVVSRYLRILRFRDKCSLENALKAFWRRREEGHLDKDQIRTLGISWLLLKRLLFQGWVRKEGDEGFHLTHEGKIRAANIVRLHRLWEVYLVHMGQRVEKVHRSAEEMEHILTPDLERRLTEFLQDPKHDPHSQPIPRSEV
jgi:manganese/zinc/iron transport system permease protein